MTEEQTENQEGSTALSASEGARALGRIKTEKKAESSRRNGKEHGGRPLLPLSSIECNCGAGDNLEGHKSTCMRGRAIKRRKAAGKL